MSVYPPVHRPGDMAPAPSLDDDGLGGVLDDTAGAHPGLDMIRDGLRLLALDRLDTQQTMTVLAVLAGGEQNLLTGVAYLVERLTNPDTNPGLAGLDAETAKAVQASGERYRYELIEFGPRDTAAEAIAQIDGT